MPRVAQLRVIGLQPERGALDELAATGDLLLTGTGTLSRNVRVGEALARGESFLGFPGPAHEVAEGIETARSSAQLAARAGVEMPITRQVVRVLEGSLDPRAAVLELMRRSLRAE